MLLSWIWLEGRKLFKNTGIGFSFFPLLVLSSLGSSVHKEKDEEHDHQRVLVRMCGRKVVKFIQDGIFTFTIILLMYATSSLKSCRCLWWPVYTEMEKARQWVIFF